MSAETQKIIQNVKRQNSNNPLFPPDNRPERTLRILHKDTVGMGGLNSGQDGGDGTKANFPQQNRNIYRAKGKQKIDFTADRIDIVEEGGGAKIHERMQEIEQ